MDKKKPDIYDAQSFNVRLFLYGLNIPGLSEKRKYRGGSLMSILSWHRENSVALISMDNGENRHNPDFLKDFFTCLDEIEADEKAKAVVLKSSDEKNWSLGLDLDWIMQVLSNPDRHRELVSFMLDLNRL